MATERRAASRVLERGDLFFVYRPSVEGQEPGSLLDVRRFFMVLRPQGQERFRLIAIGKKKLPGVDDGNQRHWGFVDGVFSTPEQLWKVAAGMPAGMSALGENLRPAGEGVYAVVLHGNHTHLVYVLELPPTLGEVQEAFNITTEARFVIAIKNPEAASPSRRRSRARSPARLSRGVVVQVQGPPVGPRRPARVPRSRRSRTGPDRRSR